MLVVATALLAIGTVAAIDLTQPLRHAPPEQARSVTIPGVLGVLGFLVALSLAVIKTWETFFQKARFEAFFDWANSPDGYSLEVSIANVGWKKDSVRTANIRHPFPKENASDDRVLMDFEIDGPLWSDLPVVLDVNEITRRMEVPLYWVADVSPVTANAVTSGTAYLVITNARGKETPVAIPPVGRGPAPPSPQDLRRT
jgi:hypothetical protein